MGRITILTKTVDRGHYDCQTCMDTGEFFDEDAKRRRPCPDCPLGKGTY